MAASCPNCGGPLIEKSRPRLLVVGIVLLFTPGLAFFAAWLWAPAIIAGLTGIFLLYWATIGKGRWCRHCKMVPR